MKKLVVTMLTVLACGGAYALPVGNPADASLLCDGLFWEGNCCMDPCDPCASWCDAFSFRFGFYGDYVFNRHLEVTNSDFDFDGSQIEHSQIFTNAGYLILNLWNRVDVFSTLGATNFGFDTNGGAFVGALAPSRVVIETSSHFSWSLGARATLWECGCTSLGIEGQYFQCEPKVMRVTTAAGTVGSVYPDDVRFRYSEWQVGLGISHRINIFVPYVAVKYAQARLSWEEALAIPDTAIAAPDFRNAKNWGYAVGLTLVDCNKMSITGEVRLADEKAFHVNAQIRF